jgi:hypothetical protein
MREETKYLKNFNSELNIIVEKIDGTNNEDFTARENDILRFIYGLYLKESKLEVEE